MKKLQKRGFELPTSFIVMVILAVLVFGLGVYFLRSVSSGGQRVIEVIDAQNKADLETLFQTGEQVAIPRNRQTSAVGENVVYWLGIQNIFDDEKKDIKVAVSFQGAVNKDGEKLKADSGTINKQWLGYSPGPYNIKPRKYSSVRILVKPQSTNGNGKTLPGSYVFNVCISEGALGFDCAAPPAVLPSNVYGRKIFKIVLNVQ